MSLSRRAAMTLPLVAGGCAYIDDLLTSSKPPLPGKREAVLASRRGLASSAEDTRPVTLPAADPRPEWAQPGGVPTHVGGNPDVAALSPAWRSSIGEGGGYRRKITAMPVIAEGRVFTMDSDAVVTAFDAGTGGRIWRTDTQGEKDRSTNVGGGVAFANGTLFATTGRAEALGLDPATGAIRWRQPIGAPARSGPTVDAERMYVVTLDDRLVALDMKTGERTWAFQAANVATTVLGRPAPAVSEGTVVAGFGSGDLVALRAESGSLAWSDSLASGRGRSSLVDLSAIRGMPVIDRGRVYAIGLGDLLVSLDLRTGRRLWEREAGGSETPWIAGDWMFVITSDQVLACINAIDGQVRWLQDLPRYEDAERARDPILWVGPAMAGGRLFVASSHERALAIDPKDGTVLADRRISGAASVSPVVASNTVFIVTDDASLQALR